MEAADCGIISMPQYRTHVLLNFVSGFGHLLSMFCLVVGACSLEFAQAIHSSVHMDCVFLCSMRFVFGHVLFCCLVLLHTACVFIGCVHSCYVLCCVARSLCFSLAAYFHVVMSCVNARLMSILINCVFMFCFAHGHVLVFLCGFCLVCMLPCVLMS